jgi:hypothetical protein
MRSLKGLTLVVAALVLVVAAPSPAAGPTTVSNVYTVGGLTVPGASTGLVLEARMSVTVTATGAVCPFDGGGFCPGPNGYQQWDTTQSSYGGFVLPGAPAWGLVGRVGNGPWIQVGSGPTTLSGTGVLVFAVNDDLLGDNNGSFTVTVSHACWPGWGYGDKNHSHCGPPGLAKKPATTSSSCRPGWGNGDTNHNHCGPPGLAKEPAAKQTAARGQAESQDAPSSGPGKSEPQGEAQGHSKK